METISKTIPRYMTLIGAGGGSSVERVLPSSSQHSLLPVSVGPQNLDQSIIFQEHSKGIFSNKWHYRGLDGRISVRKSAPDLVNFIGPLNKDSDIERVYILYPSGKCSVQAIKTAQFAEVELVKKPKGSGCKFAAALWDGSSWISSCVRNCFFFQKDPHPGITAGLGYTSAMGLVTGPIAVVDSIKALKKANSIGDVAGVRLAKIDIAKGALETGTAAVMGGIRTLSLVELSTTSKTVRVAGNVLGMVSTVGFVAIFSIYAVRLARTLAKAVPLLIKLKKTPGGDDKAFRALTDMLNLKPEEREKCGKVIEFEPKSDQLLKMVTEKVELTQKEADILTISDEEYVVGVLDENSLTKGLNEGERANLKVRYLKEIAHAKMVKEAEYKRIVGGKSLEMIKEYIKAPPLSPAETILAMEKIVGTAQRELAKQVVIHSLLSIGVLIGILSFVLAPTFALVSNILMLIMNIILSGADIKSMHDSFEALKKSSTKEKLVIALLMALSIGILATSAFFTGGGSLLIVALVIGFTMVGIQGSGLYYAWWKDRDNKRKEEQEVIDNKRKEKEVTDNNNFVTLGLDHSSIGRDLPDDDGDDLGFGDLFDTSRQLNVDKPVPRPPRRRKRIKLQHPPSLCIGP